MAGSRQGVVLFQAMGEAITPHRKRRRRVINVARVLTLQDTNIAINEGGNIRNSRNITAVNTAEILK
jgi:hypothetical protein